MQEDIFKNAMNNPAPIPTESQPLLPPTMDPMELLFIMSVHVFILLLHIHVSPSNMWFDVS